MARQARYHPRGVPSLDRVLGITQRATPLAFSWAGDSRVRFSDFQVNEIGMDGKVIHLRIVGLTDEQKQAEGITGAEEAEESKTVVEKETESVDEKSERQPSPPPAAAKILEISSEYVKSLTNLAGEKFAHDIVDMFREAQTADPQQRVKPVSSEPIAEKYTRGQIHQEVRRIFQSKIDTSTDDNGGIVATAIRANPRGKKRNRGGGGRDQRDSHRDARPRKNTTPRPAGEFLHFTLYKDNRETMDAITQIARMMRAKPQMIGYAGTKDRRASTAQRCSIRYGRQRSLAGLNGKLWGMATGDYEYRDEPVHLGQLLGNEFVITLKNCKLIEPDGGAAAAPIAEQVESLRKNVGSSLEHMARHGWINYFGHQRFGTHEIGTHDIGKLILSDKYKEAVDAILTYDPEIASRYVVDDNDNDNDNKSQEQQQQQQPGATRANTEDVARHHACMLFCTGKDPDKAASLMPRRFSAEVCVMRHLTRSGASSMRDFVGSLTHITRGLRSMYLHAYQSHVWNHAASMRWEKYGDRVIAGDLVVAEAEPVPLYGGKDQDGDDIINPVSGAAGDEEGASGTAAAADDDDDSSPVRARPLTADEVATGRYTIHDVVLPTPGYQVVYPDNEVGRFYSAFMGREANGGLDPHRMRRMRREFSLPGRYRKLMHRFLGTNPATISFRTYTDDKEQMHPTDWDVIRALEPTTGTGTGTGTGIGSGRTVGKKEHGGEEQPSASKKTKLDGDGDDDDDDQDKTDKEEEEKEKKVETNGDGSTPQEAAPTTEKIAAIIKFQLGRSAYATVALRELMGDLQEE